MERGDSRHSDHVYNEHLSWYIGQRLTFLALDEERRLEPTSREDFESGYDFQQFLIGGRQEVCVTIVECFCEVSGKAKFDCEHCTG